MSEMWLLSEYPTKNGGTGNGIRCTHEVRQQQRGNLKLLQGKIANYKVPKNFIFIKDEEMPRSGTGKILHRQLREKYCM
jgi:acyl-CoA synthetase (AMP-forming)/AMP-acid ligase II